VETNRHPLLEHIPELYGCIYCMPASVEVFIGHDVLVGTHSSAASERACFLRGNPSQVPDSSLYYFLSFFG